ncbi:MAG TPA: glycoside hydrolase family 2 TIM barrel-domain containing protein [Bryobacteraceae bacterium]|nr:glycoside hydrolase family 2 TIM barrel-domain containing protein [Bryobacteraceae bacterium]
MRVTVVIAFVAANLSFAAVPHLEKRQIISFDRGWRFLQSDAPGAEQRAFDDTVWRMLDVPHDWSIAGPFDQQNKSGGAGGFLPAGIGWYRKQFTLLPADSKKDVFIEFDGVMANSDVWINGFHLGHRPYGYVSFEYELTGHLNFGQGKTNVLAVRVDNSLQPASRWYAGAGIYRHVRLVVADHVHVDHWATFISTPKVESNSAVVHIQTSVVNDSQTASPADIEITLLDPSGNQIAQGGSGAQTIRPGQKADFTRDITVSKPSIWDIRHPVLYTARLRVHSGARIVDDELTPFGIREFHFDAATGFWLNGRNFKLKGVCLHGEAGALGTAVPLSAWVHRLEALRQIGVNAIRTAHNPPAPEFLALCDRMGLLVMDEMFDCWTVAKNPYDYHLYFQEWSKIDARDTVRRDRNHPSIILYSAGNEIHDTPKQELAKTILRGLIDTFHETDPTRPVTQALFRPNVSHDYDDGLADMLDIVGQNYRENEILAAHAAKPSRKIVGTENGHDRKVWLALRDNPPYAGQFIWSGVDYLGESRRWPIIGNPSGLFDRDDLPRPDALERQAWWSDEPVVNIVRRVRAPYITPTDPGYETAPVDRRQSAFVDWSPANLSPHDETVEVYSNCGEVELFLNGKSLGREPLPEDASPRVWQVPFEPGILRAVGMNAGKIAVQKELHSAGNAAKVLLSADRSLLKNEWDDVAYITATIVDVNGVPIPRATDLIRFSTNSAGKVIAVDNGDNASHEPFEASQRSAYGGRAIAVVRATADSGPVIISASVDGLAGSQVSIAVQNEQSNDPRQ